MSTRSAVGMCERKLAAPMFPEATTARRRASARFRPSRRSSAWSKHHSSNTQGLAHRLAQGRGHVPPLSLRHFGIHGQREYSRGGALSHGKIAAAVTERRAGLLEMDRNRIVNSRGDLLRAQLLLNHVAVVHLHDV